MGLVSERNTMVNLQTDKIQSLSKPLAALFTIIYTTTTKVFEKVFFSLTFGPILPALFESRRLLWGDPTTHISSEKSG